MMLPLSQTLIVFPSGYVSTIAYEFLMSAKYRAKEGRAGYRGFSIGVDLHEPFRFVLHFGEVECNGLVFEPKRSHLVSISGRSERAMELCDAVLPKFLQRDADLVSIRSGTCIELNWL